MAVLQDLVDVAWAVFPGCVAAVSKRFPASEIATRVRYQASYLQPDRPRFLCWWARNPLPGNIGDLLTPLIISRLFGLMPVFCRHRSFFGVGSVIHKACARTVVWGSGLIAPDLPDHPDTRYIAVRGPLTQRILRERGRKVPEIYGDPAVLMPLIHRPEGTVQHALGIVPHYLHVPRIGEVPAGVKLIDVRVGSVPEILACIDQIASCEVVASSSLHGLILALAYGRKVVWLRDSTARLTGDTFKFEDFFASLGLHISPLEWCPERPAPSHILKHAVAAAIPEGMRSDLISAFNAHAKSHVSSPSCPRSARASA